jgi:hypothetical protein
MVQLGSTVSNSWSRRRDSVITLEQLSPVSLTLESCQCIWHDSFISYVRRTGATEKNQIFKKSLSRFISQILIKELK